MVFGLLVWPADVETTFAVYADDRSVEQTIRARRTATTTELALSAVLAPTYLRIRRDAAPATVTLDGTALTRVTTDAALDAAASGWRYDATAQWLWVKLATQPGAAAVVATD